MTDAKGVTIGQFELTKLTLTSFNGTKVDISKSYTHIDLYEDIFGNVLSGTIIITDTLNLVEKLPIIGQEKLELEFRAAAYKANDGKFSASFDIYKVTQRDISAGEGKQVHMLEFFSPEMRWNLKTSISQAFHAHPEEIAAYTLKKYLRSEKKMVIEKTKWKEQFVVPNWKPFYMLNWMARFTQSEGNAGAGYLFFEDSDSRFNFVSVETLLSRPSVQKYIFVPGKQDDNQGGVNYDLAFRNIKALNIVDAFNTAESQALGMYASRLYTYDPVTKKYQTYDWSYADTYDKHKHLEGAKKAGQPTILEGLRGDKEGKKLSDYPEQHLLWYPKCTKLFDDLTEDNTDRWYQYTQSALRQLNQFKVIIEVNGDSARKVGDVVELEIPVKGTANGLRDNDKLTGGRYLVTSIKHSLVVSGNQYTMTMELTKDSLYKPLA